MIHQLNHIVSRNEKGFPIQISSLIGVRCSRCDFPEPTFHMKILPQQIQAPQNEVAGGRKSTEDAIRIYNKYKHLPQHGKTLGLCKHIAEKLSSGKKKAETAENDFVFTPKEEKEQVDVRAEAIDEKMDGEEKEATNGEENEESDAEITKETKDSVRKSLCLERNIMSSSSNILGLRMLAAVDFCVEEFMNGL